MCNFTITSLTTNTQSFTNISSHYCLSNTANNHEDRTKLPLAIILAISLFLVSETLAFGLQKGSHEQRQTEQCMQSCRYEQGHEQRSCRESCEQMRYQGGQGGGSDPQGQQSRQEKELRECEKYCGYMQDRKERQRCEKGCKKMEREQQGGEGGSNGFSQEEEEGQQQQQTPFVFRQHHFQSQRSQGGMMGVLQRFTRRSKLFRGINNYRLAYFESSPNTFTIPNHWDADSLMVVLDGRGSITILQENNKKTHNLECGDILRFQPGATVYMINRGNNEKFRVVTLTMPVFKPGQFETFFSGGGRDPESFFNAFSDDILQAAFNAPRTKLKRLFQGQNKGAIIKASRQQIESLAHSSSSHHTSWPFGSGGSESQEGPFNLRNKRPSHSNEYGQLYQVDQNDYNQLRELDVQVTFANITQGAMIGPYYNTRATKIAVVVDGKGYIELVTPYMSSSSSSSSGEEEEESEEGNQWGRQGGRQGRQGGRQGSQGGQQGGRQSGSEESEGSSSRYYQRISARLRRGDVYIVPAGHPVVAVTSQQQNLQVVCFEVNVRHNRKNPLAGRNNILNQMESEAKELVFNMPARQVDEILQQQQQSWFFPGPQQQQQQGGQGQAYA